jgi:DNA helicase II / ATP-dependent DNA helicase PcrA
LIQPLRFFRSQQYRHGDSYMFAPRSRFIPDAILDLFECRPWPPEVRDGMSAPAGRPLADVAARMLNMWR